MILGLEALVYMVVVAQVSSFDSARMKSTPLTPGHQGGSFDLFKQHHAIAKEKNSIDALLFSMLGEVSLKVPPLSEHMSSESLFETPPAHISHDMKTRAASVDASGELKADHSAPPIRKASSAGSANESLAQTAESHNATAKSETKPVYGHILPWWASHWLWSSDDAEMRFVNNYGISQGRLDPPGMLTKGVASSEDMVKAIDVQKGANVDFDTNSVGNEEILRAAQLEGTGYWTWGKNDRGWGLPDKPVWHTSGGPDVPGQTVFYHAQWKDAFSHLPSAYEPDFFRDDSEYFGPFRIDYRTRTVWVDDWNVRVREADKHEGFGNVAVGPDQYLLKSSNSFLMGKYNNARGNAVVIMGGQANNAQGEATSVTGGEGNTAKGQMTSISGGYHNEAEGDFTQVVGGDKNVAEGGFASVIGGGFNSAVGSFGVIAGGKQGTAQYQLSTIGGGWGNKGQAIGSTIGGGEGMRTDKTYQMEIGIPEGYLQDLHKEMAHMNAEVTDTATETPTDSENSHATDISVENSVDAEQAEAAATTEEQAR